MALFAERTQNSVVLVEEPGSGLTCFDVVEMQNNCVPLK